MFFPSFLAINRGDTKDTEMESIMDSMVDSLFSLFVTLGMLLIKFQLVLSNVKYLLYLL